MIAWVLVAAATLGAGPDHAANAGKLPVCANRVINEVVKRAGCTLGDARCWARGGGFCTDWVERAVTAAQPGRTLELKPVDPRELRKGDVAVFASRAHYALVEKVIRDGAGSVVAVDLSEYNFGGCWVDEALMVTEKYEVLNRRATVPLAQVDGGFLRATPAAR
jgi:hypothetical protein